MSKAKSYEEKTEKLITPIVESKGFELVDIEYVKEASQYYLRVYIDKEGGITIDDCVEVSREFNQILDSEDYIDDEYIFEVSSPGVDRPLKKDKDYDRSIGKRVMIRTYKQLDGKKEFYGELSAYDGKVVTIIDEESGAAREFTKADISIIRLAFDFDKEL